MINAIRFILRSLLPVVVIAVFTFAVPIQQTNFGRDGNAVVNSGFEQWENGLPSGWSLDSKVKGKGTITQARATGRGRGRGGGGGALLQLNPNRSNTATELGGDPFGLGQSFPADLLRGKD